jgi:hypothetical protein
MGKPGEESEARMAFERGQARHEQEIIHRLLKAGAKWTPALMHYSKTKLGWKEAGTGEATQVNRIQITLPGPMARGELLNALGQDRVLDFRKDRTVPLNPEIFDVMSASPAPDGKLGSKSLQFPPGRVSRTMAAHLKSQGQFNPSIHILDE